MNTYRVVVHSATGLLPAVTNATREQALASIRLFMRRDGYPIADLINEADQSVVKRYTNKHIGQVAR